MPTKVSATIPSQARVARILPLTPPNANEKVTYGATDGNAAAAAGAGGAPSGRVRRRAESAITVKGTDDRGSRKCDLDALCTAAAAAELENPFCVSQVVQTSSFPEHVSLGPVKCTCFLCSYFLIAICTYFLCSYFLISRMYLLPMHIIPRPLSLRSEKEARWVLSVRFERARSPAFYPPIGGIPWQAWHAPARFLLLAVLIWDPSSTVQGEGERLFRSRRKEKANALFLRSSSSSSSSD